MSSMCHKLVHACFFALISFTAAAQGDSSISKTSWFISLHSGALFAQAGNSPYVTAASILGVRHDRFALGVGTGYDVYERWRTLPVFSSIAWDVVRHRSNALYLQVNGGYAVAWNASPEETVLIFDNDGGYFLHPAVGYRLDKGAIALHLTAGYKLQRLEYEQGARGWGLWLPMRTFVTQNMERFSLQIGIGIH